MLKTLLKVRLRGLVSATVNRRRGGKGGGMGMKIVMAVLMLYCAVVFGGMFGMMFYSMREPFAQLGMGWLYFSMAAIMATMLCFIGSVFFTQSLIFEAKDNEMLLSMPVTPAAILGSRLLVLYLLNCIYALLVLIPCGIVCCLTGPVSVGGVVMFVLAAILLPLIPTTLSCLVGWLIAAIIARMRNKTIFTLALSLVFFGGYMMVCMNLQGYIMKLVENGAAIGAAVKKAMPPFYAFGLALDEGNLWQFAHYILWCLLPFALVCAFLARSFVHIATMKRGAKKARYQEKPLRVSSLRAALMKKELTRLSSSAAYMLNGCVGLLMALILGVMAVVKRDSINEMLAMLEITGPMTQYLVPLACAAVCMLVSMTIISAPSISLEGKNLWIMQSAPVRGSDVLLAKAYAHMLVSVPVGLTVSVLLLFALPATVYEGAMLLLLPALMSVFMALLGVVVNLRWPRFDYVNETVVIKQSASVMITMFGGMGVVALPVLLYGFVLRKVMSVQAMMAATAVALAIVSYVMYAYLAHRAERAFANLNQD